MTETVFPFPCDGCKANHAVVGLEYDALLWLVDILDDFVSILKKTRCEELRKRTGSTNGQVVLSEKFVPALNLLEGCVPPYFYVDLLCLS